MRRTVVLCCVLVCLLGPNALAQSTVSLRGNVGATFFRSPEGLNSVLNSGTDLGLGVGVRLYKGLELTLEGSYDRFSLNGDNVALFDDNLSVRARVEGGGLDILHASAGLRYTLQGKGDAHPYLAGGVGVYRVVLRSAQISGGGQALPQRATTRRGIHGALGAKFDITETYSFFFEPRLVIIDTGGSRIGTTTTTRYMTVRLGLDVGL